MKRATLPRLLLKKNRRIKHRFLPGFEILDGKKPEDSASLPLEPVISAKPNKCAVTLNLNSPVFYDSSDPTVDKSHNESGFFVYRSQDGKPFTRIATLPAVTNPVSWEYYHGYLIPINSGWLPLQFR